MKIYQSTTNIMTTSKQDFIRNFYYSQSTQFQINVDNYIQLQSKAGSFKEMK